MAFGFDDLLFLIAAISTGKQIIDPPKGPENKVAGPVVGQQGAGGFPSQESFIPQPTAQIGEGLDLEAVTTIAQQVVQAAGAQGPAPTVPLEPASLPPVGEPGSTQKGPPASRKGPAKPAVTPKSIGEVLLAAPEALAAVSDLLGLNRKDRQVKLAPTAGGGLGQVVQGFNLPQIPNIGQLLAQIPRLQ